jgi:hypothetical protein
MAVVGEFMVVGGERMDVCVWIYHHEYTTHDLELTQVHHPQPLNVHDHEFTSQS